MVDSSSSACTSPSLFALEALDTPFNARRRGVVSSSLSVKFNCTCACKSLGGDVGGGDADGGHAAAGVGRRWDEEMGGDKATGIENSRWGIIGKFLTASMT